MQCNPEADHRDCREAGYSHCVCFPEPQPKKCLCTRECWGPWDCELEETGRLCSLTENYDWISVCIFPEWTDGYGVLCDTSKQLYCENPYGCVEFTANQIGFVCTKDCTGGCRLQSACEAPRLTAAPVCGMATWFGYGKECGGANDCMDHDKFNYCNGNFCTTECVNGCPDGTFCTEPYCDDDFP